MVNSGLEEQPDNNQVPRVSQYKLAAHFGAALTLYTLLLWGGLNHILTPHTVSGNTIGNTDIIYHVGYPEDETNAGILTLNHQDKCLFTK